MEVWDVADGRVGRGPGCPPVLCPGSWCGQELRSGMSDQEGLLRGVGLASWHVRTRGVLRDGGAHCPELQACRVQGDTTHKGSYLGRANGKWAVPWVGG